MILLHDLALETFVLCGSQWLSLAQVPHSLQLFQAIVVVVVVVVVVVTSLGHPFCPAQVSYLEKAPSSHVRQDRVKYCWLHEGGSHGLSDTQVDQVSVAAVPENRVYSQLWAFIA